MLTNYYISTDNSTSNIFTIIDDHLARLLILSNRTYSINKYISNSIEMMIPQIRAMRYYVNGSWQECLNELEKTIEIESKLIVGGNSPTLIFARSSELLAIHLLLIYEKYQERLV